MAAIGVGVWVYRALPQMPEWPKLDPENTVSVHTIVIEEVTGLGRMELVQYRFQDLITHSVSVEYLPDPKVMLKVIGETVACLDMTKIDSSDIFIQGDTITLDLPTPEICYARIDHEQSEIVETWYTTLYAEGQKLIDQAYTIGERKMREAAIENQILQQAETEAQQTLVPLLENLTQKKVFLRFPTQRELSVPQELIERATEPLSLTPQESAEPVPSGPSRPAVIRD